MPAADDVNHVGKLAVGHFDDGNHPFGRHEVADAIDVDGTRFMAGAVANIDGKLKHAEAILQQVFAKAGGGFPLGFGLDGEVEHDVEPHEGVFA